MHPVRLLRLAAATAAAVVAVSGMAAAPALAAPKPRLDITFTAKPANPSDSASAAFSWTTNQTPTSLSCSLDGVAAGCTKTSTSFSTSGLTDGTHTFSVKGKSSSSRPGTAIFSWVVDVTPPAAPTVAPVPSPTSSTSASISFTNADPTATAHTCSLDGQPAVACTSPWAVSGLLEGAHSVVVRSRDSGGVLGGSSTVSWLVDHTAPENVQVSGPASPSASATAQFTFSATGATQFTCALDGAAALPCSSPHVVGPLADGTHWLTVTAVDGAGNTAPAVAYWTIDSTAPGAPAFLTSPASPSRVQTADFVVSSPDSTASLQCRLDTNDPSSWVACPSPIHYAGLAEGPHFLGVRAVDPAGNQSDAVTAAWTVDLSLAVLGPPQFVSGPSSPSNEATPDFDFVPTDPATESFTCSLDDAAYTACDVDSVPLGGGLGDGSHTLRVKAVAGSGGSVTESIPAAWTWVVDRTAPPAPTFSAQPPADTASRAATLSFSSEPGASFTCALDGAAATTCATPVVLFGLADGPHTFQVRPTDAAGNTGSPASVSWTVDTVAPAAPQITAGPADGIETTAELRFTAEPDTALTCAVDGGGSAPCSSPLTLSGLQVGSHSFAVRATDAAGNQSQPATHTWTVTAPSTPSVPTTPTTPTTPSTPAVTVTITADTALRGLSRVGFSRDVQAVSPSLTVAGTATGVPVALSCSGAGNAAVDCATGAVRTVAVQPKAALVPGQSYRLAVTGVMDAAGKPVAAAETFFRASTVEQENSLRAAGAWAKGRAKAAYGKRFVTESHKGATMTFSFRGKKVTWFTTTGPSQGRAKVFVDGVQKAKVDNYSTAATWKVARTVTGLTKGSHQLTIVVLGRKGARSGTGTGVVVDALRVGKRLVVNPKGVARWGYARATGASGGGYALADAKGATSSFTFRGTSVSWVTQTAPTMGKAKVFVDGVLKAKVDNFSTTSRWNVKRTLSGLTDRVHTVTIKVLGAKRAKSAGTSVVVDGWLVG